MSIVHSSVLTSSEEEIGGVDFKIYPNPVWDDRLQVTWDGKKTGHGKTRFEIRDLLGRVVTSGALSGEAAEISLPPLSAGTYLFLLTTESGTAMSSQKRSEEHTSELQSRGHLVCRLLLEKKKIVRIYQYSAYIYN